MRALRTLLPVVIIAMLGASAAWGDEAAGREDQFKAAYLFNFLKFVNWPASAANEVLVVCFLGADGVHDSLASGIENKRAGARRLAVRRLDSHAEIDGCNVLYLESDSAQTAFPIESARVQSILTVSDSTAFARRGGMIELFTDANRLRFNINVDNAHKAGLRISSNLLQLATHVEGGAKP